MSVSLAEFEGTTIYLDTMVPYALFRNIEPAATELFERIKAGELCVYLRPDV